jgi:hypothetical protein
MFVRHFTRSFRATFGVLAHGWLAQRRIDLAKDHMRTIVSALIGIALRCGFSDQAARAWLEWQGAHNSNAGEVMEVSRRVARSGAVQGGAFYACGKEGRLALIVCDGRQLALRLGMRSNEDRRNLDIAVHGF